MKKILICLFSFLLCSNLFAGNIKEIVVIGDSLSDNGRIYETFKFIPKSPPYYKGRFTNGPTWAEDVGKFFYNKSYVDTQIYAWGGATAILHNPIHDAFVAPIILESEIHNYLIHSLLKDKSRVLYIIWIGANDYLYDKDPDMNTLTDKVVDKILWSIQTLVNQGAKNFLLMTLPDLSTTPYAEFNQSQQRLKKLATLHNQKLLDAIKNIGNPDIKVLSLDIFTIFNDLLINTQKYNQQYKINIINKTEACWQGGMTLSSAVMQSAIQKDLEVAQAKNRLANKNFDAKIMSAYIASSPSLTVAYAKNKAYENGLMPCKNANQYVFWDELHPTETVHAVLAQIVEEKLMNSGISI